MERPIMNEKDLDKEIQRKMKERQLKSLSSEDHRAQAITIGNAGGGITEISMRGVCGGYLWNVYQPVEVVEIINQLAANIGCHIHIQPRNDFSSWRGWREISQEEKDRLNGFPPFSESLDNSMSLGTGAPVLASQENVGKFESKLVKTEKKNVAIKKAVNKRSTKRSKATSR